jgi:hypothetical protein
MPAAGMMLDLDERIAVATTSAGVCSRLISSSASAFAVSSAIVFLVIMKFVSLVNELVNVGRSHE